MGREEIKSVKKLLRAVVILLFSCFTLTGCIQGHIAKKVVILIGTSLIENFIISFFQKSNASATTAPENAVESYYRACNDKKLTEAYDHFSSSYHSEVSLSDYQVKFDRLAKIAKYELVLESSNETTSSTIVTLTVLNNNGKSENWTVRIVLIKENNKWKMDSQQAI